MAQIAEIRYRIGAPVLGHFPGHHRSVRGDSGFEFRGHASLLDAPDPRRLDLHASLRDPFGDWRVRVHSQRKAISVVMLADVSASMGFRGRHAKLEVLADFAESLAWSAWRSGDAFGFVGCDSVVRSELLQLPTRARSAGGTVAQRLRAWHPDGRSAQGLLAGLQLLPRQPALVFLVSDFHMPLLLLVEVLAGLARHNLVPVVLWDALEFDLGERRGLAQVIDPESGRQRLVWWRPALRAQWRAWHTQRREALLQLFRRHRLRPLFIEAGFDADAVTRHFHG